MQKLTFETGGRRRDLYRGMGYMHACSAFRLRHPVGFLPRFPEPFVTFLPALNLQAHHWK